MSKRFNHMTNICYVQTTFLGADSPSIFYFTDVRDAVAFLDELDNGEIYTQLIGSNESLGSLHGEMWMMFVNEFTGIEARAISRAKLVLPDECATIREEMRESGYTPNLSGTE